MADESEDETCNQGEASSENEEEEIEPKEEKDEEYDVKPGDNDPSANGGEGGKGSFAKKLAKYFGITWTLPVWAKIPAQQGRNTPPTPKLLICGSDAGAHVLAGIASSKEGTSVRVLCLSNDVAQQWNSAIRSRNIEVTFPSTETPSRISSKPSLITKSERVALQDIDIVVFTLPASDHPIYFRALKNYVTPGTVVVGLPGNPQFMALSRKLLCPTGWKCTLIRFESLPWVCKITEFGTKCEVLSTRESLSGRMEEGDVPPLVEPVTTLQYLLGPRPDLTIARNRHL